MNYIVVAEKGSVAKSLRSFFNSMKINAIVSSVRGHIFDADLPFEFKKWRNVDPSEIFKINKVITVIRDKESYQNITGLFKTYEGVLVIATDNDHEGELIGFEILSIYRSTKGSLAKFYRMRFNSTSKAELLRAWRNLESDLNWRWVDKAIFRRNFDLITGAAFTRLLTLKSSEKGYRGLISWGSCQTCTLYFISEREKEIINFKPQKYWYFKVDLEKNGVKFKAYSAHIKEKEQALKYYELLKKIKIAKVKEYRTDKKIIARPLPLRTDDALKDLTKITKLSASKILAIMEDLYANGYISYPRTDTNKYRPDFDFNSSLKAVIDSGILSSAKIKQTFDPRNGELDDGAHPPIYPVSPYKLKDIRKIVWDYIARRFIANAYMDDAIVMNQRATLTIGNLDFNTEGKYLEKQAFFDIFNYFKPKEEKIPDLVKDEEIKILRVELVEEETKPPPRLSESELLDLMEKHGIGTDATRAIFPSLIIKRNFAYKQRNVFKPTPLGLSLIESLKKVDEKLVTPATRKYVEDNMKKIELGKLKIDDALNFSLKLYQKLFESVKMRIEEIAEELANVSKV